jgi:hypothetical protein
MTFRQAVPGLLLIAGVVVSLLGQPALAAPIPIGAVASIAEMQGLNGVAAPVVQVLSYYPGLNRGGGLFVWNATSGDAPDGCTAFAPQKQAGQKGRWVRQLSGALDATMCGAYWDNVHDDAAALTRAFAAAAALRVNLNLPGGTAKVCSSVKAAHAVTVRGQGMSTNGASDPAPTLVNGTCIKSGWVFDITAPAGAGAMEAPKYYDMGIQAGSNSNPGGCIRWNDVAGGFVDGPGSQLYMMHPHAERIYCDMPAGDKVGFECSKCFNGDFSQNSTTGGKHGISLEGSDVMCIGCAGPNRFAYATDSLVRMVSHGTFGNMDRVVGNEILYPTDTHQRYDSFIYDATRSSTIEANHIEGIIPGVQSAIHVVGGFSHAIENNDIDVLTKIGTLGPAAAPHWLVAEGPFVNFSAFNNGCAGCILGPALFKNHSVDFNAGGVRQVITHGGNAVNGDAGFP